MRRGKDRRDGNHGRRGFVSGNGRYSRARPSRKMGRSWQSSCWRARKTEPTVAELEGG